uniref:Uncharacterized protein n=1 Tax=viral metagenome TaxID=1070528 RepID=A0A6M3M2Y0_9ZZZZ
MPKRFNPFLSPYTAKELKAKEAKVFLSDEAKSGYAIMPDGDLVNVFSMAPGQGGDAVRSAIKNGATKLDCFDSMDPKFSLPNYYNKFGFEEYDRVPWSDKYKPTGWSYKKFGRPDVVYMTMAKTTKDEKSKKKKKDTLGKGTKVWQKLVKEWVEHLGA